MKSVVVLDKEHEDMIKQLVDLALNKDKIEFKPNPSERETLLHILDRLEDGLIVYE